MACLCLFASQIVLAQNVYIAKDESLSADKVLLIERFKTGVANYLPGTSVSYWNGGAKGGLSNSGDVVVTLGEGGLRDVLLGEGKGAVIAAFISQKTYYRVVSEFPKQTRKLTAVFSNPSPRRQLALAKAIYGEKVVVGLLNTSTTADSGRHLELAARDLGITLEQVLVDRGERKKKIFDQFVNINAFLLQKNEDLFEIVPLDKILLLAYDIKGYGIIGFSNGVVRNGALATTYSSLEDNTKSISSLVKSFFKKTVFPPPGFGEHYRVGFNKYVARSLNLKNNNTESLEKDVVLVLEDAL